MWWACLLPVQNSDRLPPLMRFFLSVCPSWPWRILSKTYFICRPKKMSTKAWCFMELDEIGDNKTVALEIYRKPTDFTRKRFNLLSVKPLFLHLHISLQKV